MTPEQQQRMTALASANDKRIAMARHRKQIRELGYFDGLTHVARLLEANEDCDAYGMPIARLMTSVPRLGPQKAERICVYARVSGHRRVRDLTDRQRNVIARVLRERTLS
jgi:hypothetical protein